MRMPRNPDNWQHGVNRYRQHKCRCDECCAAYAEYRFKLRKNPEGSFTIDPEPLIRFIEKMEAPVPASTQQTFARWREKGVDIFVADRHCCKRGAHPFEVYGSEWFELEAHGADRGDS